jgi:hypothetical protein
MPGNKSRDLAKLDAFERRILEGNRVFEASSYTHIYEYISSYHRKVVVSYADSARSRNFCLCLSLGVCFCLFSRLYLCLCLCQPPPSGARMRCL